MSRIDFDTLIAEHPEQSSSLGALKTWFVRNYQKRYVELSVLLRAVSDIDQVDIIFAIETMLKNSIIQEAYRIKLDGQLLEGTYTEPDQIPETLWTRGYDRQVNRDDGDLVSGYTWEASDAA